MRNIKHHFNKTIIRSYDIRGVFNKTLFEKDAKVIGQLFGSKIGKNKTLNVGYDGRNSSLALKESLIEGILESGANVC
jgi:phosphomannomutase